MDTSAAPRPTSPAYGPNGRYTILNAIGNGTYGSVFAARDNQQGNHVAIKRLEGGGGGWSQENRGCSDPTGLRELQVLQQARYEHIVTVR